MNCVTIDDTHKSLTFTIEGMIMVQSMTAYARREKKYVWGILTYEMRSVNHRFLEMSFKLPEELRVLEMELRSCIKQKLKRGKLDILLQIQWSQDENEKLDYNQSLAKRLADTLHDIDKSIYNPAPVNAVDILMWTGVLTSKTLQMDEFKPEILQDMNEVLDELIACRTREGEAIKQMIIQRSDEIQHICGLVKAQIPEILQSQRQRLQQRLEQFKADLDNDRLEQEMVFLAQKADVDEELDRITTHMTEIARVLKQDEAIGRRLDFLMQELNREANTLGSKSISKITTQAAVDLKVLIEQMREQIQNIE
jgi:uncharacterized protein (TIGR00255 family)